MISISGKKWEQKKTNKNLIEKIKQNHNFTEILSRLIILRKFDENEIYSIENNIDLKNIFLNNPDFNQSLEIVLNSIKNKENICILGDYDVDGSAATSLFVKFFNNIKHPFFYYIPDREKDGYGASKKLFQKLLLKKPKLIIMVDCGSTANEAIDFLNLNNVKSLIIDHHEINKPFPKANVIINPKKNNGYIEYDYLCATTLVYFFLELLSGKIKNNINMKNYLMYALLATVCDVMPLRKLNRIIALKALKEFKVTENYAFNELYNLNNKKNKININDLGYLIGPILNAGGRLGKSNYATELLSTESSKIVSQRSIQLTKLNNKRKEIETKILNEINFDKIENNNKDVIIYYNSNINEGLIGIIAARLKEFFNKPSIVITTSGNTLKGSARSIFGYNIGSAIKNALDANIILTGGGHAMAAGFTLKKINFDTFEKYIFNNFLRSNINNNHTFNYDAEISSIAFNKDFLNDIKKMGPFGTGNPVPTFFLKDFKVIKTTVLNNKHIFSILKSRIGFSVNSITFNSVNTKIGEYLLNYKKNFNIIGQINETFWNNKNNLQLTIRDIIL